MYPISVYREHSCSAACESGASMLVRSYRGSCRFAIVRPPMVCVLPSEARIRAPLFRGHRSTDQTGIRPRDESIHSIPNRSVFVKG